MQHLQTTLVSGRICTLKEISHTHTPDTFLQPLASGLQQIHLGLQLRLLVLELFKRLTQLPDGLKKVGVLLPTLL